MTQTFDSLWQRLAREYEQESGQGIREASDTGLRLKVLAGELYRLSQQQEWLRRQAFPQTATGDWLDRHGEARGVFRSGGSKAQGTLRFSRYLPLSFDYSIPKGTLCCSSGDGAVQVETLQEAVIQAGALSVDVPAQAVESGSGGNLASGTVTTLLDALTGVNFLTNPQPFTGGSDAEGDELYRARILKAYAMVPTGSNAAWYRDAALSYDGITAAQAVPRANGAGTVALYLWGEGAEPSAGLLARVEEELSAQKDIGVTLTVAAASSTAVNVYARVKYADGADTDSAQERLQQSLNLYFAGKEVGEGVPLAEISRVILDTLPVIRLEYPSSMRDVSGTDGVILVPGSLTLEVIA